MYVSLAQWANSFWRVGGLTLVYFFHHQIPVSTTRSQSSVPHSMISAPARWLVIAYGCGFWKLSFQTHGGSSVALTPNRVSGTMKSFLLSYYQNPPPPASTQIHGAQIPNPDVHGDGTPSRVDSRYENTRRSRGRAQERRAKQGSKTSVFIGRRLKIVKKTVNGDVTSCLQRTQDRSPIIPDEITHNGKVSGKARGLRTYNVDPPWSVDLAHIDHKGD